MNLVDYTHPIRVPALCLPLDRRSEAYYLRFYELPKTHLYYDPDWILFRYPEWMDGGSAWLQATYIVDDLRLLISEKNLLGELRPVVGSDDPGFDEALAQALRTMQLRPLVADVIHPR